VIVQKGYKTELKLNNKQRTDCLKHAGVARYAFNWGLSQKKLAYEKGEKTPNAMELHRRLNAIKLQNCRGCMKYQNVRHRRLYAILTVL